MAAQGSNFIGILTVLLGFALIAALCRWAFNGSGVRTVHPRPDYGLLTPIARRDSRPAADAVRESLALHAIRATVAPAGKGFDAQGRPWPVGSHIVLVFPPDADRATALLSHSANG